MRRSSAWLVAGIVITLGTGAAWAQDRAEQKPSEQSLEKVLARYASARGGAERWHALESISAKGTFTSFSRDAPFTLEWTRPGYFHFDSSMLGGRIRLGHDARGPWWAGGVFGAESPRRPNARLAAMVAREGALEPPLIEAKKKGHKVTLLGPGDVDGTRTIDLRLELASGGVEVWHLDATTYLELAVDSTVFDFTQTGEPMDQRAYFSDFRPVGGVVLPFRVEKEYKSRYTVQQIAELKVGEKLPDERFRMPITPGMEPLRALEGEWEVTVEGRTDPRQPWSSSKTTATIRARDEGTLLEETVRFAHPFVGELEILRLRSWDLYRETYRFVEYDVSTSYLNVFEGKLADGRLVTSNQTTGTEVASGGQKIFERWTMHGIEADRFQVDWEVSFDGGQNWFQALKMAYARREI